MTRRPPRLRGAPVGLSSSVRAIRALEGGEAAFLAALRATPGFEFDAFGSFIHYHRLRDWVAPALTGALGVDQVPVELRAALTEYGALRRQRNADRLRESVAVRDQFASQGIETLFLKGLYFGERLYGDVNLRHQGDIDVLVHSANLEAALAALGQLGFDISINNDSRKPMALALGQIRGRVPELAPHAVTVRRGDTRVDLHWCLTSRSVRRVSEDGIWAARRPFELEGHRFETLSDPDTLMFMLVSIGWDVRRGACRVKHLLDLQLLLRGLEDELDWDDFFERRRREKLEKVCASVLALFLAIWECADQLPRTTEALAKRRNRVELRDRQEALDLVSRPRRSLENRVWFRRVHPRSMPRYWAWCLTKDLPYTLRRIGSPQGFAPGAGPTRIDTL